ncbi:ribonuclease P protein component [Gaetbulibacter sp. M240]|uniref:ribonuclease P protein component n=1 Tax=Gaetbulibacter sp. M240 TaxID=3126511 RepID=UPI00374F2949
MIFTLNSIEKLKGKKLIEQLFEEGRSVSSFPLRLVYITTHFKDGAKVKTGVSVSKKSFKRAVDRNRIKRLMREAYRLNKTEYLNNISEPYAFMILYNGKEIPTYSEVEAKMAQLFLAFSKKISDK